MEITFSVKDCKSWCISGELISYSINMSTETFTTMELRIKIRSQKILDGESPTPIIKLPDSQDGAIRLGGTSSFSITHDGIACVELLVQGFYPTYEDAAAAEMEYRMTRKR